MTTLFDLPESKSPRLLWMERHKMLTHYFQDAISGQEWMAIKPLPEDEGLDIAECMANNCRVYDETGRIGYGLTEDEALANLAIALGVKLWNEEV